MAGPHHGVEHPLGQDQAIGHHHHGVGARLGNRLLRRLGLVGVFAVQAQAVGLGQGQAVVKGKLFDGRGLQLHAAPGRPVGLGEHQGDSVASLVKRLQRAAGKLGRARKDQPQRASSRWALSILVLMRLRLRGDRYSTNTLPIKWSISC